MMDSKASPTSHTYFSQRLRLHYLDWGNAGAPPLLLVLAASRLLTGRSGGAVGFGRL